MAAHKWWSTIAIQEVYSKIYMATRINSVSVAEALHVEEEASGISATQAELVGGLHSNQNAGVAVCCGAEVVRTAGVAVCCGAAVVCWSAGVAVCCGADVVWKAGVAVCCGAEVVWATGVAVCCGAGDILWTAGVAVCCEAEVICLRLEIIEHFYCTVQRTSLIGSSPILVSLLCG